MKQRVMCFGDSNTYGYDPRSPLGERYSAEERWTGILNQSPRWEILNYGENGREIPDESDLRFYLSDLLCSCGALDGMVVMLGTNDLLHYGGRTAAEVADRMEAFLRALLRLDGLRLAGTRLLLVSPPAMAAGTWVTDRLVLEQSALLGDCYRRAAERLGVAFADAARWNVALSYDGVHFTPAGHRTFAGHMEAELARCLLERDLPSEVLAP